MTIKEARILALRAYSAEFLNISATLIGPESDDEDLLNEAIDWVSELLKRKANSLEDAIQYDIPHGSKISFKKFMKSNPKLLIDFNSLPKSMKDLFFNEWNYRLVSYEGNPLGLKNHMDSFIEAIRSRLKNE